MIIVIVQSNEWQGAYLNGVLVNQNHNITAIELLRCMDGYKLEGRLQFFTRVADQSWMDEVTSFPQTIEEVKFAS